MNEEGSGQYDFYISPKLFMNTQDISLVYNIMATFIFVLVMGFEGN